MPITPSEVQYRLSGGAANASAAASIGGAKSANAVPANLFDDNSGAESAAGDIEYRCFYVHNNNGTLTLQNPGIYIQAQLLSVGHSIAIGVGASAVNGTETAVANEDTAPAGVSFSAPVTPGTALALGNIPPGQHRAVWIRRTVAASSPAGNSTYNLRTTGDTLP
jgi:hypothetical protein